MVVYLKKDGNGKKLIFPIIIVVLTVGFSLFWGVGLLLGLRGFAIGLGVGFLIFPLLIAVLAIYVLCERIKEIRSGIEDDLSKY